MRNIIAEKYKKKYKELLQQEQTKDLVSLLLTGYNISEATEIIHIASTFNCSIDVASIIYED